MADTSFDSFDSAPPPEGVARTVFALSGGPRREKLLSLSAAARSKKARDARR